MGSSMDDALKAMENARRGFDQGLRSAAQSLGQGIAAVNSASQELYASGSQLVDMGQAYVDQGVSQYKQYEDLAFATAMDGIHWALANPYISYPSAGLGALLLLPFTRRMLYRQTLGRFRNPESVARSCEGKVRGIGSRMEQYGTEVQKLQDKMTAAEAEYRSGMSKLKSARQEMQRLSSSLAAGERSASAALRELRTLSPKVENVLQLRGEAAGHAAALRNHKLRITKYIRRIAAMDV